MARPKLITISGPTAIGKTSFAVALAQHLHCPILSSDSRQFYKEMSIGTAVPTAQEQKGVSHYFIQHKSIHDLYSVGDFEKDALSLLDTLYLNNDVVILVGGSNLYSDAVTNGLDDFPDVSESIKRHWQQVFKEKGIEFLQETLKRLDPDYYTIVDQKNHVRLLRALGVCKASGMPYSTFFGQPKKTRSFDVVSIELTMPREKLYERINLRVDNMVGAGLIEEVQELHKYKNLNALQTVGYRELFLHFEGKQSKEESLNAIKMNTRRFAKRQLTWLRNHPCIHQVEYNTNVDEALLRLLGIKKTI